MIDNIINYKGIRTHKQLDSFLSTLELSTASDQYPSLVIYVGKTLFKKLKAIDDKTADANLCANFCSYQVSGPLYTRVHTLQEF